MSLSETPIAFAGGIFDHDETGRDPAIIQSLVEGEDAVCILLHKGMPALDDHGALIRVHPKTLIGKNILDPGPIYLGKHEGAPVFAASLQFQTDAPGIAPSVAEEFQSMRAIAGLMSPSDLAIAGRAKALFDWHYTHRFCAKCGQQSFAREGGLKRQCPSCETEHFPRVNPVVIMLVVHGDQCLLGRGAGWPEGAFSALAGFVSPGETMEEACAREVWEETGVMTTDHRYVMSQPWPFPSQLMMGMICTAEDTALTINTKEIETAQWFSKDTVKGVFSKTNGAFLRPPRFTIAHQLLRWWIKQ